MMGSDSVRPGVTGTVSAISGTTLTVTSKKMERGMNKAGTSTPAASVTYTVDASNATVTKNNTTSTLSAIAVGDTIMVQGTVSGTNVTATTIRDLPAGTKSMMNKEQENQVNPPSPLSRG